MSKKIKWLALAMMLMTLFVPAVRSYAADAEYTKQKDENGVLHIYDAAGTMLTNMRALEVTDSKGTKYYNVDADGAATQWKGAWALAARQLNEIGAVPANTKAKTLEKSLNKAFKWSSKLKYYNVTKKRKNDTAYMKYYGIYGFEMQKGECIAQSSTFVLMAQVLGYDAHIRRGYMPSGKKNGKYTGLQSHAWAEVKVGKKAYAYDANVAGSKTFKKVRKTYPNLGKKFQYNKKGTLTYLTLKKKLVKKTTF